MQKIYGLINNFYGRREKERPPATNAEDGHWMETQNV